jgi:ABC-type nitrate/sulfonate/bicarbonate transport system substrate-binding protein
VRADARPRPPRRFRWGAAAGVLLTLLLACSGRETARPAPAPADVAARTEQGSAGAGAEVRAAPLTSLTLVYTAPTVGSVPLWLAHEQGLYARYGLDVTLMPTVGTTTALAALLSGQAEFVEVASDALLPALVATPDLVAVATLNRLLNWRVIARPEIRGPADLRGKRIGIGRYGDSPHVFGQQALERLGLDPARDVSFVQVGQPGARVVALQSGAIDATLMPPPAYLPLVQEGYPILANLADLGMSTAGLCIVATRAYAEAQPAVVEALVRGIVHGIAAFKQDAAASKAALAKYTDTTDEAVLEESYRAYVDGEIIQRKPYSHPALVQAAIDHAAEDLPAVRGIDAARVWDNAVVQRLDEAGFVDALYR